MSPVITAIPPMILIRTTAPAKGRLATIWLHRDGPHHGGPCRAGVWTACRDMIFRIGDHPGALVHLGNWCFGREAKGASRRPGHLCEPTCRRFINP